MQYDIFISYKRRDVSSAVAAFLYDMLLRQGYSVFFDRKEMRTGRFDEQLLENIANAKDVIILFEQTSLSAWYDTDGAKLDGEDAYKEDWFCKEVMHGLKLADGNKKKNIIPLMLNSYEFPKELQLPPEMSLLNSLQHVSVESWKLDEGIESIKKFFLSRPVNLALSRQLQDGTSMVGRFLFYTSAASCDLFECGVQAGERLVTLTDQNDETHAFCYPVAFAGEHRFNFVNNDTCEEISIKENILVSSQKFIEVKFSDLPCLWNLTDDDIAAEGNAGRLCSWGKCLYKGNVAHKPDVRRSFLCLRQSIGLGNGEAKEFLVNHCVGLIRKQGAKPEDAIQWYALAAGFGGKEGQYNLASMYRHGRAGVAKDLVKAQEYYQLSADQGYLPAICKLGEMYDRHLADGQKADYVTAIYWHRKAALQGNARSMRNLAVALHHLGQDAEALQWAIKAASALPDDAEAKNCLEALRKE